MDKKKWLVAYLIYRAGQNSRRREPEREYEGGSMGIGSMGIGSMGIGCMAVCAVLGMLLAALLIWIFKY